MADPRNELAGIVVPAAPDGVAGASGLPLLMWAGGLTMVACLALGVWLAWHRRRPARALQKIATTVAQRQNTLPLLAEHLDSWARVQFNLSRVDTEMCPPGLDPAVWSAWVNTLAQVRFAPSPPGGFDQLAALCETARQWNRHV
ncbi:MAG: hypothetical protein ACYCZA_11355 [Thiobacillus sp.]